MQYGNEEIILIYQLIYFDKQFTQRSSNIFSVYYLINKQGQKPSIKFHTLFDSDGMILKYIPVRNLLLCQYYPTFSFTCKRLQSDP